MARDPHHLGDAREVVRAADPSPAYVRVLVTCFAAVVACFAASLVYSEVTMRPIDSQLDLLATKSMPSIEHLTATRANLRHSEQMLEEAADGHPWGRGALQQAMSGAETEWFAYEAVDGASVPRRDDVRQSLEHLQNVMQSTRERLATGDLAAARRLTERELRLAALGTDEALGRLVSFHLWDARRIANGAERARQHATNIALALDGASVVVSIVLALAALHAFRKYRGITLARANELEQFSSRVAHDIRGPLTPALFALQRMQKVAPDEPTRIAAERGVRSVRVVESIIDGLLSFAQSGVRPDTRAATSVHAVLEDVLSELRPLAAKAGIALSVEPFIDVEVACGAGVLASILSNLVRNAIKYMGSSPDKRIEVRVRTALLIRIEIADSGPGLPPGMEAAVFEPYVRGPASVTSGLGLGLATVKRLADAHGGAVGVQSRAGRGCTFWVALPTASNRKTQALLA